MNSDTKVSVLNSFLVNDFLILSLSFYKSFCFYLIEFNIIWRPDLFFSYSIFYSKVFNCSLLSSYSLNKYLCSSIDFEIWSNYSMFLLANSWVLSAIPSHSSSNFWISGYSNIKSFKYCSLVSISLSSSSLNYYTMNIILLNSINSTDKNINFWGMHHFI